MAEAVVKRASSRGARQPSRKNNNTATAEIVTHGVVAVKYAAPEPRIDSNASAPGGRRSGRRKTRRQSHGMAWHWKQTAAWYYTLPGTKKRIPLFDQDGHRIRGVEDKTAAHLALARIKPGKGWQPEAPPAAPEEWIVAKVCSDYLQYCERGVSNATGPGGSAILHLLLYDAINANRSDECTWHR